MINPAGEQLTPENRNALKRLYGSEPLDVYSSSEHGLVSWQCKEADLYHINHEAVCVEVLDEHGAPVPPGTAGALVITGLSNALMPLLRYRTGDVGVMATRHCRCGHSPPALAEVQGREIDWLVDARGRRVAPQRLWLSAHVTDGLSLVHRYQVRHRRPRQSRSASYPADRSVKPSCASSCSPIRTCSVKASMSRCGAPTSSRTSRRASSGQSSAHRGLTQARRRPGRSPPVDLRGVIAPTRTRPMRGGNGP